jgi:hypothetical protein
MPRQMYVESTIKGPTEILDHSINWAEILAPLDDEITDFVAEVDGDMVIWSSQFTALDTTVWLSGGTIGVKYTASHTITTKGGRKFRRSVLVRCLQR